jgi:hypothetical protein
MGEEVPVIKKMIEAGSRWLTLVILATWEAEIMVQGQPGQEVNKTRISTNKLSVVAHTCHIPSSASG